MMSSEKSFKLFGSFLFFGTVFAMMWFVAMKIPFAAAIPLPEDLEELTDPTEYTMGVVLDHDDDHFENGFINVDTNRLLLSLQNEINGTKARLAALRWLNASIAYSVLPPGKLIKYNSMGKWLKSTILTGKDHHHELKLALEDSLDLLLEAEAKLLDLIEVNEDSMSPSNKDGYRFQVPGKSYTKLVRSSFRNAKYTSKKYKM